jgi:hypothetical protein
MEIVMMDFSTEMDTTGERRLAKQVDDAPNLNSAVSWPAIFAGAAGAAALSLLLLLLGTGLGFSAVSPWITEGVSVSTIGFAAIVWLSFTQLAASGMGGYLAGRLRARWLAVHIDEVYFRDTAHGFLSWAVATLLVAVVVTSVGGAIISGAASASASVAGGVANSATAMAAGAIGSDEDSNTIDYYVDALFRSDSAGAGMQMQQSREASEIPVGEVVRIFMRAMRTGTLPQQDQRYVGQLIAQRTDLNQQQAEQRVSESFEEVKTTLEEAETTARAAADEARKASAYAALWMFITLLMGAFAASLMAVFGGRQRDT